MKKDQLLKQVKVDIELHKKGRLENLLFPAEYKKLFNLNVKTIHNYIKEGLSKEDYVYRSKVINTRLERNYSSSKKRKAIERLHQDIQQHKLNKVINLPTIKEYSKEFKSRDTLYHALNALDKNDKNYIKTQWKVQKDKQNKEKQKLKIKSIKFLDENPPQNKDYTNKIVRKAVIKRANGLCEKCGNPGNQVHHTTYENIGNESTNDLILLCGKCHLEAHKNTLANSLKKRKANVAARERTKNINAYNTTFFKLYTDLLEKSKTCSAIKELEKNLNKGLTAKNLSFELKNIDVLNKNENYLFDLNIVTNESKNGLVTKLKLKYDLSTNMLLKLYHETDLKTPHIKQDRIPRMFSINNELNFEHPS
jgi:hypothetical protein